MTMRMVVFGSLSLLALLFDLERWEYVDLFLGRLKNRHLFCGCLPILNEAIQALAQIDKVLRNLFLFIFEFVFFEMQILPISQILVFYI